MWVECPLVLDDPVKIAGFEVDDLTLIAASAPVSGIYVETLTSLFVAAAVACLVYLAKRGKAPGAVLHALYDWGMPLPGILSMHPTTYSPW